MIARLVLLLPLALAFCALPPGGSSPAAEACRQKAYQDQDVKDQIMLSNSGMSQVRSPALMQLDWLLNQKVRDCLGTGGVEAVKPY